MLFSTSLNFISHEHTDTHSQTQTYEKHLLLYARNFEATAAIYSTGKSVSEWLNKRVYVFIYVYRCVRIFGRPEITVSSGCNSRRIWCCKKKTYAMARPLMMPPNAMWSHCVCVFFFAESWVCRAVFTLEWNICFLMEFHITELLYQISVWV